MDDAKGLAMALEEAELGYQEGGVPVSETRSTHIHTAPRSK